MSAVEFTREAYQEWLERCQQARERGTETHAYLLGRRSLAEVIITVVLCVGHVIEEAIMMRPDYGGSAVAMRPYLDAGFVVLGEVHKHPDNMPGPSSGDRRMLLDIPSDVFPGYLCMVTSLVDGEPVTTAHSVQDGAIIEHPVRVIDNAYPALLPTSIKDARVLQLGAGSGASLTPLQLAKLGVQEIMIIDHDHDEDRNLRRHLATRSAIGKSKAKYQRNFLKDRSTSRIRARDFEISAKTVDQLEAEIARHTLVVNGTGHPVASVLISRSCARHAKPVIRAGAFARGSGGFVFIQVPGGACYECLYGLKLQNVSEDKETMETLTKQYGYSEEELHAQLGLWADVNTIASIQSKVIVEYLKYGRLHDNLYLVDNHQLTITKRFVQQRNDCTVCNGGAS